jgi:S1-C subfamily serine protease
MSFMLVTALLVLLGGPAAAGEAAFNPSILHSVVTVFPVRDAAAARTAGDTRGEERSGSGVVVRPGGYIATNYHVVLKARQVFVRLADGREMPAEVVASDETTDIALLKVGEELPALATGREPPLGARVCTVSDPFGVGLSVTCGVVSAARRTGMGFNMIEDFIQTDAVLNPGSSGGALVDGSGKLVGLVAAIFTRTEDANIGINFAISVELLNRVVDDLVAHGEVLPAYAGFRLSHLPRTERRTLAGLRIAAVESGDAADRAGFRAGDVVTDIAGRKIRSRSDALTAIYLHRPGDRIDVSIVRDGQRLTLPLDIPK